MTANLITQTEHLLSKFYFNEIKVNSIRNVPGGCINVVYRIETTHGPFLVKTNHARKFPNMFAAEAAGLQLLKANCNLKIPELIWQGEVDNTAILILEYIESGKRIKNFFEDFGNKIASMHKCTSEYYGLDNDNYIGSLNQFNKKSNDGVAFFISQRLMPQIELAISNNKIDNKAVNDFEKLFMKLNQLLPAEPASLIHGDLWSGNFITDANGMTCIFDPAVSYSYRESDIAMTKLFGGFESAFYEGYNDVFLLQKNWQNRIELFNLYPLMVHVNLFGGSYLNQCREILKQYL